jgi:hypothetical protein
MQHRHLQEILELAKLERSSWATRQAALDASGVPQNSAPFEIVCAPYTVYVAPIGSAMPAIDDDEAAILATPDWNLLGTSGAKNYTDAGVAVTHGQTVSDFTPAGSTTPRKVWRTGETLTVGLTLADVSPEQYALVINNAAISTVAAGVGTAGEKHFQLMRGVQVSTHAILVRGISSVDEALNAQYEIPCAYEAGNPAPTYSKANPAELAVEWHTLELTPGVFGTLRVGTAPAA